MGDPTRTWQLISVLLAFALALAMIQLHRQIPLAEPAKSTSPTVNNVTGYEHLALSPNARRAHQRYWL